MLDKLNHLKDEMCDELMELTDKRTVPQVISR